MNEKMFPILNDQIIKSIPWAAIEGHEQQAQLNQSQTLAGLASRGGLSPCEAVAILMDKPWQKVPKAWARAKLMQLLLNIENAPSGSRPA